VSPGGTLIDSAVTVGHNLVAHSPAGISIDGGSVGHDLRIEGLSGSAGGQNRISNTTVGHDLVVEGNANAVALAGNSVGHDLRVDGATASNHAAPKPPAPPHPAPKPKPPKPHHEPKLPEPPKSQDKPKPQHTPPPKPVHEAEQHTDGHGH
jgi:cell division septation protein DedD